MMDLEAPLLDPDPRKNRLRSTPLAPGVHAGLWTGTLASAPVVLATCAACTEPTAAVMASGVQGSGASLLFAIAVVSTVVGLQLRRVASSAHHRQALGGALMSPLLTLLLAIATYAAMQGIAGLVLDAVGTPPGTSPMLLP